MSKPDWCPQDVWDAAIKVHGNTEYDEVVARAGTTEELHAACDHDVSDIARAILAERERCRAIANERAAQLWAGIQQPLTDETKAGWVGQMIEALQIEQRIADGRVPVDSINIEGLHKAAKENGFPL